MSDRVAGTSAASGKEAIASGLKHYFTGRPCPAGHVAERRIKSGSCMECERARVARRRTGAPAPNYLNAMALNGKNARSYRFALENTNVPPGAVAINLFGGGIAFVDPEDAEMVSAIAWHAAPRRTGTASAIGRVKADGKTIRVFMHNLIMNESVGHKIDHANRNPLDNRKCNLRVASRMQNSANIGLKVDNTSGYKGIRRNRAKFQARISTGGVVTLLGSFCTPEEAALAYDAAALERFGEFAWLNSKHGALSERRALRDAAE